MAEKFEYKYNAPTQEERKEIDNILKDYLPEDSKESKINKLRTLDFKVKNYPIIYGLSLGIIGTLVFGTGLTCILEWSLILLGIIVCVIGLFVAVIAYPIYNMIYKKLKNKYSKEIIDLSNELLNITNSNE